MIDAVRRKTFQIENQETSHINPDASSETLAIKTGCSNQQEEEDVMADPSIGRVCSYIGETMCLNDKKLQFTKR